VFVVAFLTRLKPVAVRFSTPGIANAFAAFLAVFYSNIGVSDVTSVASEKPFTVSASFPAPIRIHHLSDWQAFESIIVHSCTVRLVRNRAGKVFPDLAESWTVSPDGKSIRFVLNKAAVFKDGTQITAVDAAYAITRHIALKGQYADSMRQSILQGQKIKSPKDTIEGIRAVSKSTLEITLNTPAPEFFEDLGMMSFSVFRTSDVSETEDQINHDFMASGAYEIARFEPAGVLLKKNKRYWDEGVLKKAPDTVLLTPSTEKTDLARLLAGEIDVSRANSSTLNEDELARAGVQVVQTGIVQYYLNPDFKGPALSRYPELAPLINLVLSRESIVASLKENGIRGIVPIFAFTGNIQLLDDREVKRRKTSLAEIATAKKKISEIAQKMKRDGLSLKFAERDQNALLKALSVAIKQQLKDLGMPFVAEIVTPAFTYRNQRFGEFDIYISGESFDTSKPLRAAKFIVGTDHRHTNVAADHPVFEVANQKPKNYDEHVQALVKFNDIVNKYGLAIPLFTDKTVLLFSKRVDISRVTKNDYIWHPSDVGIRDIR
jgi:ABC-type transport system substrate-binding protein